MNRLIVTLALVIFSVNLLSWSEPPIEKTNRGFDVSELLIADSWQESAPIFLADSFDSISVSNVGSEQELGFSFQRELVSAYGEFEVNRDAPIDLTQLTDEARALLATSTKFSIEPFCNINPEGKYCPLAIAWDEDASESANFVGARVAEAEFALIEQRLLEKLR